MLLKNNVMKKIMLIYPPGSLYQRGEDRCQINVEASISNAMRSCNDLGIVASILRQDYKIFLKDYQTEKLSIEILEKDFRHENPDIVFISITNGSIFEDLKIAEFLKSIKKEVIIILKGALFFNPEKDLFNELNLNTADYLIGGEIEFIIKPLLEAHYNNKKLLEKIEGICYKKNGEWVSNNVINFNDNLDDIPFPDRSLMNNSLYINPLSNKPMATISASRGCPSSCIYCLSPLISGKKVRFRSIQSVLNELIECVDKYNITEFFFKSDTFTINKNWVLELCNAIINSPLNSKISWCANSRVNTIDEEMIIKMKEAGCTLIALGIESGSQDSLIKMKKGTNIEQSIKTVNIIKKYGISILGFYLIGFPWETLSHLEETKKLIFKLDTDFIELSIIVPFKGSDLYNMYDNLKSNVLGKDSFKEIAQSTQYISIKQLKTFRKKIILLYHLRFSFIIKQLKRKNLSFKTLLNYINYGIRLFKNF